MINVITYSGRRPTNQEVESRIIKGRPYIYLVATKALERDRQALLPESQRKRQRDRDIPIGVFDSVLREWVREVYPIAGKGDEKNLLQRAIVQVAQTDSTLKEVLRKDLSSWLTALADIASRGIDLSGELSSEQQDQLVNPYVGELLSKLQHAYYRLLKDNHLTLFEEAARRYLTAPFTHFQPLVIMEGFTYLTHLQHFFAKICHRMRAEVVFLAPYSAAQPKGFKCIRATYSVFPDASWESIETESLSEDEDLAHIQTQLFADHPESRTRKNGSAVLRCFPNRDREIFAAVEQLRTWFSGTYTPQEVAVIVRNPAAFKEVLQDFLHASRLSYIDKKGSAHPVQLHASPRLLLLTPVGRFILTLYDIWDGQKLKLNAEQFETIIASGWLGAALQESTIQFRALKEQFFAHCESEEDWRSVLATIESHMQNSADLPDRMPLNFLSERSLNQWKDVLGQLHKICASLFQIRQGEIARHIARLRDEISRLEVENIRAYEQDILQKIQELFEELNERYSMSITTAEFGEALHALVRQKPDDDDSEVNHGDEGRLWITTPEGIDSIQKKAVLYIGVDNRSVPAPSPVPWPFFEDKRTSHIEKERYMFLTVVTVVRAAREQLVITAARHDGEHEMEESMYMSELARLLEMKVESLTLASSLDLNMAPELIKPQHCTPQRRRSYQLSELSHYGLCPLRYCLEMRHPEARMYRNSWQLEVYAQGVWLDTIFQTLQKYITGQKPTLKSHNQDQLRDLFTRVKNYVKPDVQAMFPSLSAPTWHGIEQHVSGRLEQFVKTRGSYTVYFLPKEEVSLWRLICFCRRRFCLYIRPIILSARSSQTATHYATGCLSTRVSGPGMMA